MNMERWIGSVINLPSVLCFGVCGNILTVSHNTPICTNFYRLQCSTSINSCGKRVLSMLFSLLLYMILGSVVSAALFHVLVHHIEETVAIALLFYIIVMN